MGSHLPKSRCANLPSWVLEGSLASTDLLQKEL